MSNEAFFFGNKNLDLGPANIYYDASIFTGDGGTDVLFGGTQGLTINMAVEKADLTYDQYGTSPANRVATGQSLTVAASLVQLTTQRMENALQGFVSYENTGGSLIGFSWESILGEADSDIEAPLKVVLVNAGIESTDPDNIIYIPNAAPMVESELSYDAATQRVLAITWNCYRRSGFISSVSGKELFLFSQSMLDNGLVIPGTT
ncbi:MAG TPA: hypothetical protein VMW91_08790 [Desulfosporosinus sp.]|nr:hypothetical protein [Desulfosporosinus sp.]